MTKSDDISCCVWDARTGKRVHEFQAHPTSVNACQCSPDGSLLALGSRYGTISLWDLNTGTESRRQYPDTTSITLSSLGTVFSIFAFTAIEVRTVESNKLIWTKSSTWVKSMAISSDDKFLATCGKVGVYIFDLQSGRLYDLLRVGPTSGKPKSP